MWGSIPRKGKRYFCLQNFKEWLWWLIKSPIQWELGGSLHRGKAAGGYESDTSPPPSARVKHENSHILPMLYDNFTCTSEILFLKCLDLFTEKATELLPPPPLVVLVHRDRLTKWFLALTWLQGPNYCPLIGHNPRLSLSSLLDIEPWEDIYM
jgi:hypothetical protein